MDASAPPTADRPAGRPRLRRALGRIRRSFQIDTFDVFARPVRSEDAELETPAGYRFAWVTPDEIAACDAYHTELDERERREGAARLGCGHRCVGAFHERDGLVFTMWENPRNLNTPGQVKRRLAPDQAFIYKAYTSPDHRGRKLYQAGMRFVLRELARQGKRELIGYAHVKKDVSRRGLARLDFEPRGRYWCVRAPGWSRTFVSRALARHFPTAVPRTGAAANATSR